MLTRFKKLYLRFEPGSAFRFSRQIAGALTGTFFVLGGICEVPLKNFLFGYGSALTTLVLSTITFVFKVKGNYQESNPDNQSVVLNRAERQISTKLIIDELQLNFNKTKNFLKNYNISERDIKCLETWEMESEDDIQDVLTRIFNEIEFDLRKYPVSLISAIITSATHFMECLLLIVYVNPSMFDYTHGVTPANIGLSIIALLAIIQGILEFFDVKKSFEHPSLAAMSNSIFKAYNKYQIDRDDDHEADIDTAEKGEISLQHVIPV